MWIDNVEVLEQDDGSAIVNFDCDHEMYRLLVDEGAADTDIDPDIEADMTVHAHLASVGFMKIIEESVRQVLDDKTEWEE